MRSQSSSVPTSPRPLGIRGLHGGSTAPDIPLQHPGEVLVMLDTEGHGIAASVPATATNETENRGRHRDWAIFFKKQVSISRNGSRRILNGILSPMGTPPLPASTLPAGPAVPVRIEAQPIGGKPVSFEITRPLDPAFTGGIFQPQTISRISDWCGAVLGDPLVGGHLLARRNLRLGGEIAANATRFALFVLALSASRLDFEIAQVSFADLFICVLAVVM